MKKFLFPPFLLLFAACAPYPYYGPGPRGFWGPEGMKDLLGALLLLLLLGASALGVVWFFRKGRPSLGEALLAPRLKALREAWQALGEGRSKEAEAKPLRAEALLDLLREG